MASAPRSLTVHCVEIHNRTLPLRCIFANLMLLYAYNFSLCLLGCISIHIFISLPLYKRKTRLSLIAHRAWDFRRSYRTHTLRKYPGHESQEASPRHPNDPLSTHTRLVKRNDCVYVLLRTKNSNQQSYT